MYFPGYSRRQAFDRFSNRILHILSFLRALYNKVLKLHSYRVKFLSPFLHEPSSCLQCREAPRPPTESVRQWLPSVPMPRAQPARRVAGGQFKPLPSEQAPRDAHCAHRWTSWVAPPPDSAWPFTSNRVFPCQNVQWRLQRHRHGEVSGLLGAPAGRRSTRAPGPRRAFCHAALLSW